jgi:endonuclease/exonuclease/phosphatase family metal-dependent hydrolase
MRVTHIGPENAGGSQATGEPPLSITIHISLAAQRALRRYLHYEGGLVMKKWVLRVLGALAILLVLLLAAVWLTTFHPAAVADEPIACAPVAPTLEPGQPLKLLTWNVQYMAGKNYVFFSDLPAGDAPDERPSPEDISTTLGEVARVIRAENPDIVLLQEVDDGAARTDYEDQLARLLLLLPPEYICHTTAFYWKAAYVPHPRIHGAAGMKLAILSKYRIASALRHQLPLMPNDPISQQFNLKRALLEAHLPVEGGRDFVALDTHLDAFAQGNDTMARQVAQVDGLMAKLTDAGNAWIIGGDFNLLPSVQARAALITSHQDFYNPEPEIAPLYAHYRAAPSYAETSGADARQWYTYNANDPAIKAPDRTLDYLFFAKNVQLGRHYVRQRDTLRISDHLPLIAEVTLP